MINLQSTPWHIQKFLERKMIQKGVRVPCGQGSMALQCIICILETHKQTIWCEYAHLEFQDFSLKVSIFSAYLPIYFIHFLIFIWMSGETENSHFLFPSQMSSKSWGWTRQKVRVWNSTWVSPMPGKNEAGSANAAVLSRDIGENLESGAGWPWTLTLSLLSC